MRIMVTGTGGPSAISVWKSLHPRHELFMVDIDPCASGLYLVDKERRFIVPRGDAPEFVSTIIDLCKKCEIGLLIPTVDAELAPLAEAKELLRESGAEVMLCQPEILRLCRDKHALLEHCRGVAPVPHSFLLNTRTLYQKHDYPLFAKPRSGAGSTGLLHIIDQSTLASLPADNSYLIQELLPGEEYSVDVYVKANGCVIAAVPRLRMKTDSGIAVTARTVRLEEAIVTARRIAEHVGIRYVANIQLKRSADGVLKLLEINPVFQARCR